MTAPAINVTVRDQGLGISGVGSGSSFAKLGCSPLGLLNTVLSAADNNSLVKQLGNGGGVAESAALAITAGGSGPVRPANLLLVPVNPSTYGTAGAVSHSGTGSVAPTVTAKPATAFQIRCVLGGAVGTSTWQTSVDGGVTYGSPWVSAATVIIPGVSYTTLAFAAGTAVTGDMFFIATTGTVTNTGSDAQDVTHSASSIVDAYSVVITITTGGARGVGMFTISLDGGVTTSQPYLIPSSGNFVVTDGVDQNKTGAYNSTGMYLAFAAGTYVVGDTFTFVTTGASCTTSDLTAGFNALIADQRFTPGNGIHVVGAPASSSAGATLLAALDLLLSGAAGMNKWTRLMMETPQDTDSAILAAYANAASTRVSVAAGYETQTSPLNGRVQSRSIAWQAIARAGCVVPSEALGRVDTGSLPGVVKLTRDEFATPGLDTGRFLTGTSLSGKQGAYITGPGRIMAPTGSDYSFWPYGRVMDIVCSLAYQGLLKFLNASVRVNPNGTISSKDAVKIESWVTNTILNGAGSNISSLVVQVDRTNNLLATQTLLPTIRVVPVGYVLFVNADIGFTNQGLAIQAAA